MKYSKQISDKMNDLNAIIKIVQPFVKKGCTKQLAEELEKFFKDKPQNCAECLLKQDVSVCKSLRFEK